MFTPTEPQTVPTAERLAILAELIATGMVLDACKLILFANNIVPGPTTVLADLVEATFTGYSAFGPIVWGTPFSDVDATALVVGGSHEFVATDGVTPNVIYGWALTDTGKTILRKAATFSAPVGISAGGQAVVVVPWFRYSGN